MDFVDRMAKAREAKQWTIENNLIKKYERDAKRSRSKAVAAMCFACQGGDRDNMPDPGWKKEIAGCLVDCPLHEWRPYKLK